MHLFLIVFQEIMICFIKSFFPCCQHFCKASTICKVEYINNIWKICLWSCVSLYLFVWGNIEWQTSHPKLNGELWYLDYTTWGSLWTPCLDHQLKETLNMTVCKAPKVLLLSLVYPLGFRLIPRPHWQRIFLRVYYILITISFLAHCYLTCPC